MQYFERHKRNLLNSISGRNPQEVYADEMRILRDEMQSDKQFRIELDKTIQSALQNIFKKWK